MVNKFERIPSGILGLDEMCQGGFEKNSAVLVSGGGGSGKTIFALQFLLEGIKNGETGIYISFEERKDKFYRHMLQFGWDLEKFENQGKFVFITYTPEEMAKLVDEGGKSLKKDLKDLNAKRIVIDSLSAFAVLFDRESDQRKNLVALFEMIADWDATTVVIAEVDEIPERHRSTIMGFMADAIIKLYMVRKRDTMSRGLEIFKMRGTKHYTSTRTYVITDKGIKLSREGYA